MLVAARINRHRKYKKLTLIERGEHIHSGNNTDHFIVVGYKNTVYVLIKEYLCD